MSTASHKPFIKPNGRIRYVSSMSSHPPTILKNLPENILRRLSTISSGEEEFKQEVDKYQYALEEAGYMDRLIYTPQPEDRTQLDEPGRKSRHRKVIWFNPPWSSNVKTNVAGRFISLIKKHFPPSSDLYKLFNTKKVKVSYSTCPNMEAYIKSHNTKLVKEEVNTTDPGCNCRGGKSRCPLQGRCQIQSLVYKAKAQNGNETKEYIGQTAITFKLRFNNHTASFVNHSKKNNTTLSHYFWRQKVNGVDTNITWKPISITNPYSRGGKQCSLCLTEKATIARGDPGTMLNKRSEVMKKCWHKPPHMLNNFLTTLQPQPKPPGQNSLTTSQPSSQEPQPPPTPDPPNVQPTPIVQPHSDPTVILDEHPKPQRRSTRAKRLVSYKT